MKLDYDEALQRIGEGFSLERSEVSARALQRTVWVAEWHLPGCLSESFAHCSTKRDAIDAGCSMAEGENGVPRGMRTSLREHGRFDSRSPMFGTCINTVYRVKLWELF